MRPIEILRGLLWLWMSGFLASVESFVLVVCVSPTKNFCQKELVGARVKRRQPSLMLQGKSSRSNDDDDDDHESSSSSASRHKDKKELPLLPHFGSSSQSTFNPFDGTLPHLQPEPDKEQHLQKYVAHRRFELQYTCNVCETRNCHKVSRIAYRKGVVIATCKGCQSQHLIADNLGFTNLWDSQQEGGNIEEYFANKGMQDTVNRVSKDVFDLEKVLRHDSDSGSIVGDDGKPAME